MNPSDSNNSGSKIQDENGQESEKDKRPESDSIARATAAIATAGLPNGENSVNEVELEGKRFIATSVLAREFGYDSDHIGRLARQGKVENIRLGKRWFVTKASLESHKRVAYEQKRLAALQTIKTVRSVPIAVKADSELPRRPITVPSIALFHIADKTWASKIYSSSSFRGGLNYIFLALFVLIISSLPLPDSEYPTYGLKPDIPRVSWSILGADVIQDLALIIQPSAYEMVGQFARRKNELPQNLQLLSATQSRAKIDLSYLREFFAATFYQARLGLAFIADSFKTDIRKLAIVDVNPTYGLKPERLTVSRGNLRADLKKDMALVLYPARLFVNFTNREDSWPDVLVLQDFALQAPNDVNYPTYGLKPGRLTVSEPGIGLKTLEKSRTQVFSFINKTTQLSLNVKKQDSQTKSLPGPRRFDLWAQFWLEEMFRFRELANFAYSNTFSAVREVPLFRAIHYPVKYGKITLPSVQSLSISWGSKSIDSYVRQNAEGNPTYGLKSEESFIFEKGPSLAIVSKSIRAVTPKYDISLRSLELGRFALIQSPIEKYKARLAEKKDAQLAFVPGDSRIKIILDAFNQDMESLAEDSYALYWDFFKERPHKISLFPNLNNIGFFAKNKSRAIVRISPVPSPSQERISLLPLSPSTPPAGGSELEINRIPQEALLSDLLKLFRFSSSPKPVAIAAPSSNQPSKSFIRRIVNSVIDERLSVLDGPTSEEFQNLVTEFNTLNTLVSQRVPAPLNFTGNNFESTVSTAKLTVDNVQIDGNAITVLAGNLELPITLKLGPVAYTWPGANGTVGQALTTSDGGILTWTTISGGGASLSLDETVTGLWEFRNSASVSALFGSAFPLTDCSAESQTLLWNSTTGKFSCGSDSGGAGGAEFKTEENGATVLTTTTILNFDGGKFTLTSSGSIEAKINLDWGSGGPASRSAAQTISGLWTFTGGASFSSPVEISTAASISTLRLSNVLNQQYIDSAIARDSELHDAVTLAGTPNYLTLSGQQITLNKLDISDDTNATGGTGITISTNDFAFNATELNALTWGDNTQAANAWAFNLSGTDPTLTFRSGGFDFTGFASVSTNFEAGGYASIGGNIFTKGAVTGATSYNGLVITPNTGTITTGVWNGTVINSTYGGTGINNGGRTITLNTGNITFAPPAGGSTVTLANNFTTAGNFALTLTQTGATNVTLPTTGTLAILGANTFTGLQTFSGGASSSTGFEITTGNLGINAGTVTNTRLEVGGTASISGAVTLGSTLSVVGAANLSSTLGVTGLTSLTNASVSATLEAAALKSNTLSASGATLTINAFTLGGALTGGNQTISALNTLQVNTIEDDDDTILSINDTLSITGGLDVSSRASVSGNFEVGSNVFTVRGNVVSFGVAASHSITGDLRISDDLAVLGSTSLGTLFGAGLTDCDAGAGNKALNWSGETGLFSCTDDDTSGGGSASLQVRDFPLGTTVSNVATISFDAGHFTVTASGSIDAVVKLDWDSAGGPASLSQNEIVTGEWLFNNDASVAGNFEVTGTIKGNMLAVTTGSVITISNNVSTSANFEIVGYASASAIFGAGLTDCDAGAGNKALNWSSETGKFSCTDDDTGGGGGALIEVKEGFSGSGTNVSSVSFDADTFKISFSGTEALVRLDYATGPASRAFNETITGFWEFRNGASISGGSNGVLTDLNGTGDFIVRNGGTTYLTISDAGLFTFDGLTLDGNTIGAPSGNITLNSTSGILDVQDAATFASTLTTTGRADFNANASVSSNFEVGSNVFTVRGNVVSFGVAASHSITGDLIISSGVGAASVSTATLWGASLSNCGSTNKLQWANGTFSCVTDQTGGGGGASIGLREGFSAAFVNKSSISFDAGAFRLTTSDADARLYIDYATGPASRSANETITGLWEFRSGASLSGGSTGLLVDLDSTGDFIVKRGGTTYLTITDAGLFTFDSITLDTTTIGTTSGNLTLDSQGTLDVQDAATFAGTLGVTGLTTFSGGASSSTGFEITTGNLGINAGGSTNTRLEVGGTASISGAVTLQGAITGATGYNGLVITPNTGTITTGTWNGTVIGPAFGGTGVANNAASTLTISGNFATTLTVAGVTSVTLPTTGTLAILGANTFTGLQTFSGGASSSTGFEITTGNLGINAGAVTDTRLEVGGTASISGFVYNNVGISGTGQSFSLSSMGFVDIHTDLLISPDDAQNVEIEHTLGAGFPVTNTVNIILTNSATTGEIQRIINITSVGSKRTNTAIRLGSEFSRYFEAPNFYINGSGVVVASGALNFARGTAASTSYSRLGIATTNRSLSTADDLLISGDLEVDTKAWFDNTVSVSSNFEVSGIASISLFRLTDSATGVGMVDCDADTQALGWDTTSGRFFCGDDDSGGGGGIKTEEDGTQKLSASTILNFENAFTLFASGSTETRVDIKDDSLNFSEFADGLTLDVGTTITFGSNNFTFNLDGTGDFIIQDGGTPFFTFLDTGAASTSGQFNIDVASTRAFVIGDGTGGTSDDIFIVDTTASGSNPGIDITATNLTSAGTSALTISVPASTSAAGPLPHGVLWVTDSNSLTLASLSNAGRLGLRGSINSHGSANSCTGVSTPSSGCIDLAENFPTDDSTLVTGEVVSITDGGSDKVVRATPGSIAIGVISTNPAALITGDAFLTGAETAKKISGYVPIALAGRVPVKVSTENGPIAAGDYLTNSATLPGVAMKATQAGQTIGQALTPYSGDEIGEVIIFIQTGFFGGQGLELMAGVSSDDPLFENKVLSQFIAQGKAKKSSETYASNQGFYVDTLAASSGIISPQIYGQDLFITGNASISGELFANRINAKEIAGLEIITDSVSMLSTKVAGLEAQTPKDTIEFQNINALTNLTSLGELSIGGTAKFGGNAAFNANINVNGQLTILGSASFGLLNADKIIATEIESPILTELTSNSLALASISIGLDDRLSALESDQEYQLTTTLELNGGLSVSGMAILNGGLFVNSIGKAGDTTAFLGDIELFGQPYFNSDTGGFLVVSEGATYASVSFEREYLNQPVVNVTISFNAASASEADEQLLFDSDIRYIVTNKSAKGFTVKLNKPAPFDIQFSWITLAIKDAKTFFSPVDALAPSPTPSPSATPEPIEDGEPVESTPESTPEPSPSESPTPSPEPSPIPSPSESPTPEPSPTPEATPEPTPEPTPESTPEPIQ